MAKSVEYIVEVSFTDGDEWWVSTSTPIYDRKILASAINSFEFSKKSWPDRSFRVLEIVRTENTIMEYEGVENEND